MAQKIRQISEKQPELETTYRSVVEANALLGRCTNTRGMQPESMLKLLDLKKELQDETEKYQKVFADIMSHYGIEDKNGVFDWREHTDVKEISEKVTELIGTAVTLKNAKFMDGKDFVTLTEGQSLNDMSALAKFLRKD